jgi:hypothetical protein
MIQTVTRRALCLLVLLAATSSGCTWADAAGPPVDGSPDSVPNVMRGRPCADGTLSLSSGPFVSPGTGQNPRIIRITNRGASCVLEGYPTVRFLSAKGEPVPFLIRRPETRW